ncbi:MAG: hypothetical protein KA152_17475, partial [Verrucomicrobiales bacterium]|nr:hypothetical protein [Verrucomicrobiales bacterium]
MKRRTLLRYSAGLAALGGSVVPPFSPPVSAAARDPLLEEAIAPLLRDYLTPQGDFYNVERGNPIPYKLPPEKRLEIGLERETWKLEVFADPADAEKKLKPALLGNPMTTAGGN